MTAHRDVELFLRAQFEATADATVLDGQIDAVLSATAARRQQPAWLAALRSNPMTTTTRSFGRPLAQPAWALLMILALLVAITTVGIATGTFRLPPAPVVNGPIVFGRYNANLDDTEIYLARPDGSGIHQVLAGPNECPQFSPDGTRLSVAFATIAVDGSYRKPFPALAPGMTFGCSMWSPNGQQLATEAWSVSDPAAAGIFRVNADGSDPTRLTTNGTGNATHERHDLPGEWSPSGQQIVFSRNVANGSDLWVVDVADGATRRLAAGPVHSSGSWSPDGQWIAFAMGRDFVMVHPDGTGYHTLKIPVTQIDEPMEPTFSPDGTRLVFSMKVPGNDNADVYTMKIDGTDLVQITNTPNENEYGVDWGIDPK